MIELLAKLAADVQSTPRRQLRVHFSAFECLVGLATGAGEQLGRHEGDGGNEVTVPICGVLASNLATPRMCVCVCVHWSERRGKWSLRSTTRGTACTTESSFEEETL